MPDKRESIFSSEWRRCLRQHYQHVIRQEDDATLETLEPILYHVGFREDELNALAREVTNTAPVDTTPEPTFDVHPAECACAACMDEVLEEGHDEDGQPLDEPVAPPDEADNADEAELIAAAEPEFADEPDEQPKQKSLF